MENTSNPSRKPGIFAVVLLVLIILAGFVIVYIFKKPAEVTEPESKPQPNITLNGKVIPPKGNDNLQNLTGSVLNESRDPVAGASVFIGNNVTYLSPPIPSGNRTWKSGISRPGFLISDDDGMFNFNQLVYGKTDVWAEHPNYGKAWIQNISTSEKDIEIILGPQPELLKFEGKVIGSNEKALKNADIKLYAREHNQREMIAQTSSDNKGRFSLEATPPWSHTRYLLLLCVPNDTSHMAWKMLPYCSGDNIILRQQKEGAVIGRVVDKDGVPLPGAVIQTSSISDPEYGRLIFSGELKDESAQTQSDENGEFQLNHYPIKSRISLFVDHPEKSALRAREVALLEKETRIADIRLPDGISIEGTVRYAETNEPAESIAVTIEDFNYLQPESVTNENGEFRLDGVDERSAVYGHFNLLAMSGESQPVWVGSTVIEKDLKAGDHESGIDIVVHKSISAKKSEWISQRGQPMASNALIAVLDDSDRAYNGKNKYNDTVTVYNSDGHQSWRHIGINTCQTFGASHALTWNPVDKTLWVAENVGKRLLKFNKDGELLWQDDSIAPEALEIDPVTGNVWVLKGKDIQVLNPSGEKLGNWEVNRSFDINYSKFDDCFWLAGKNVVKLDKSGNIIYESENLIGWFAVSISVNELDGSVWIAEGRHSQVSGSKNRILIMESDGSIRKIIDLESKRPMSVVIDEKYKAAWVGSRSGLLKFDLAGEKTADIPLTAFSVCIEPDTGYAWVATQLGIYRLDRNGLFVWSNETQVDTQKWLCAIY